MALLDKNQYLIKEVQAYCGDHINRSTCTFLIWFEDNDLVWLPYYSLDIGNTVQFEAFCVARLELYTLFFTQREAQKVMAALNISPITEVEPGDSVYVDLRFMGLDRTMLLIFLTQMLPVTLFPSVMLVVPQVQSDKNSGTVCNIQRRMAR